MPQTSCKLLCGTAWRKGACLSHLSHPQPREADGSSLAPFSKAAQHPTCRGPLQAKITSSMLCCFLPHTVGAADQWGRALCGQPPHLVFARPLTAMWMGTGALLFTAETRPTSWGPAGRVGGNSANRSRLCLVSRRPEGLPEGQFIPM